MSKRRRNMEKRERVGGKIRGGADRKINFLNRIFCRKRRNKMSSSQEVRKISRGYAHQD